MMQELRPGGSVREHQRIREREYRQRSREGQRYDLVGDDAGQRRHTVAHQRTRHGNKRRAGERQHRGGRCGARPVDSQPAGQQRLPVEADQHGGRGQLYVRDHDRLRLHQRQPGQNAERLRLGAGAERDIRGQRRV